MTAPGFAVIDVETTGLNPALHDRVIEIAIVQTDERGEVQSTWETLVNPGRDLGPQTIHHIAAADVLDAPTFAQVAAEVVRRLDGRVIVAHNAAFDVRFLTAELERAGVDLWQPPEVLCTMQLARHFLPGAGRSLHDCCSAFDIVNADAHRALADAEATAELLRCYIAQTVGTDDREFWRRHLTTALDYHWPDTSALPTAPAKPRPTHAIALSAASFLGRISVKLPELAGIAEHIDYLALLDRALLDRQISVHEADALVALAEHLDISRQTIVTLHGEYFDALVRTAWADGELTEDELADIVAVADLLDIATERIAEATEAARWVTLRETVRETSIAVTAFQLAAGDLIVLTGEMSRPREEIEEILIARGYVPWNGITKKVKLLVAADPDSLSGKAKKARDYGITIVNEPTLWSLIA
jgi:DNA polymerase III subunit epsilon